MQRTTRAPSELLAWAYAIGGVVAALVGGLFIAQAGGSDREFFLSVGFILAAVGALGIVIGGVAVGVRLSRD